jgi:hypothetical protein
VSLDLWVDLPADPSGQAAFTPIAVPPPSPAPPAAEKH